MSSRIETENGKSPSPGERELYVRCDEVLHYMWDPIGIADMPGARDEYHSYLPAVFRLVCSGASVDQVTEFLVNIEKDRMMLSRDRSEVELVAVCLLEWKGYLFP